MNVLLIAELLQLVGNLEPAKRVNHNSWITMVTSTDRPKSIRIRCAIDVFVSCLCPFDNTAFVVSGKVGYP